MTHDQSHDHDHGHSHSHSHNHDDHSHSHGPSEEMTVKQKLEKLVAHWIDHNDSHKDTFFTWADRAKDDGLATVADKIKQAGELSQQVTDLLKQAEKDLES